MLSKRMSAASMDGQDALSSNSTSARDRTTSPVSQTAKPSAIPRPSMQHTPSMESSRGRSGSFQRSRTASQPLPFHETTSQSPPPLPSDSSSRSTSPMMSTPRGTRIPVSRARTGSTSSSHHANLNGIVLTARGDSGNGFYKANGTVYGAELTAVDETHQPASFSSHSTLKSLRSGVSELVNERPPFNASSVSVRRGYDDDYAPPRMSSDSEERPFEHWYRGDVSRNGGVGELRVGRRQEMLDIANYGHTLRQASSRTAISTSSRSRSNSRGRDATPNSAVRGRPRAESVGARESIYIVDDDKMKDRSLVLDERPPTDMDSDEDDAYDEDEEVEYYGEERTGSFDRDARTISPPHSLDRSDTPTLVELKSSGFKSRIPTPTPRTTTPTSLPRRSDSPGTPKASHFTIPQPSSPTIAKPPATKPAAAPTAKRKAKSPAAAAPPTKEKRPRQKPPAKTKSKPKPVPKKDDRSRESVAEYPAPEGDDIMHAVPSWTQPVPPSGNWDDVSVMKLVRRDCTDSYHQVVLPVVARKKGLEEHYQQANGSPKPRPRPSSNVIAPVC